MENEDKCYIPVACSIDVNGDWLHQHLIRIKDNFHPESKEMMARDRLAKFRFDIQNKSAEEVAKKTY